MAPNHDSSRFAVLLGRGSAATGTFSRPHSEWAGDVGARVVSHELDWAGTTPDLNAAIAASPNTLFIAIAGGNGGAVNADTVI